MTEFLATGGAMYVVGVALCLGLVAVMLGFITRASRQHATHFGDTSAPDLADADLHNQLDSLMAARTALDADQDAGRISADDHAAASLDIDRRLLSLSQKLEQTRDHDTGKTIVGLAVSMAFILTVSAAVIYGALGRPDLTDNPLAGRRAEIANRNQAIASTQQDLAQNLAAAQAASAAAPQNVEAWLRLAEAAAAVNDSPTEIRALRTARQLTNDDPSILSLLAEALSRAADGQVTVPARSLIDTVLAADPSEPRALFLFGLAAFQDADYQTAITRWQRLLSISTPDAPWLPLVRTNIQQAADAGNIQLAPQTGNTTEPEAGPDADSIAAAADMTPEAREAMIISMVENLQNRLDSEPNDTDGWLRLARAYDVLGNQDAAFTALAAAAASAPEDLPLHYRLLERTIGTSLSDAQFALANAALDRIQKRAADGPQYLFFKGHLAQLSGDNAAARAAWTRLLNTMPKDSEMANALAAEIGKLD